MKLKNIIIQQPEVKVFHITDYPIEDQQRWMNIQPFKPVKSSQLDTTASQSKRRMPSGKGA